MALNTLKQLIFLCGNMSKIRTEQTNGKQTDRKQEIFKQSMKLASEDSRQCFLTVKTIQYKHERGKSFTVLREMRATHCNAPHRSCLHSHSGCHISSGPGCSCYSHSEIHEVRRSFHLFHQTQTNTQMKMASKVHEY